MVQGGPAAQVGIPGEQEGKSADALTTRPYLTKPVWRKCLNQISSSTFCDMARTANLPVLFWYFWKTLWGNLLAASCLGCWFYPVSTFLAGVISFGHRDSSAWAQCFGCEAGKSLKSQQHLMVCVALQRPLLRVALTPHTCDGGHRSL